MKNRFLSHWKKITAYVRAHKTRSIIGAIVLVLIALFFIKGKPTTVVTAMVTRGDLNSTVLATGEVTSITDLNLSFNASDTVSSIYVKVGDKVKKGALLAMLNNRDELASLTTARGAKALAEANYQKVLDGASSEEITLAQVALDSAKTDLTNTQNTQDILVSNAYRALLNSTIEAKTASSIGSTLTPTISGTYIGTTEGVITLSTYASGSGGYFNATGLVAANGLVSTTTNIPLGTSGLFIVFPTGFSSAGNTDWTITIPNTQATNYVTNLNAYNSALQTKDSAVSSAESLVATREAELNLKKAAARPAEVQAAQADILSAEGRFGSALAAYENTIIRAPAYGTITVVDVKIGELATAQKSVITLQDISDLYLEANINESNIASIVVDQDVAITFDAFSRDIFYKGKITSIDPSATIDGGIVNYKIKAVLTDPALIKPGMTANMTIHIFKKENVLSIPKKALIVKEGGFVVHKVINKKKGTFTELPVTTGLTGDGNMVEIQTGVSEGDELILS